MGSAPEYIGGKDYEPVVLPLIDIDWRGRAFASTQRGLGFSFFRSNSGFRMGTRLTYDLGRDSSDDPFLRGLRDIDPGPEAGLFFDNYSGPWRISADLRKGLVSKGHNGILGSLLVAFGGKLNQRASLILGASVTGGDAKYNNAYFGVTGSAAGLAPFTATSGLRDAGTQINFIYLFSERVYATATSSERQRDGVPGSEARDQRRRSGPAQAPSLASWKRPLRSSAPAAVSERALWTPLEAMTIDRCEVEHSAWRFQ